MVVIGGLEPPTPALRMLCSNQLSYITKERVLSRHLKQMSTAKGQYIDKINTIMSPIKIALTGGIACGKSNVARSFAELGVDIIDLDKLSRQVVEPGSQGRPPYSPGEF